LSVFRLEARTRLAQGKHMYFQRTNPQVFSRYRHEHSEPLLAALEAYDNSIDAGATIIKMRWNMTGLKLQHHIVFEDDGRGMGPDAVLAYLSNGYHLRRTGNTTGDTIGDTISCYGEGGKAGPLRFGADMLVQSRTGDGTFTTALLSHTFHNDQDLQDVFIPLESSQNMTKERPQQSLVIGDETVSTHEILKKYTQKFLPDYQETFDKMAPTGTCIFVFNIDLVGFKFTENDIVHDPNIPKVDPPRYDIHCSLRDLISHYYQPRSEGGPVPALILGDEPVKLLSWDLHNMETNHDWHPADGKGSGSGGCAWWPERHRVILKQGYSRPATPGCGTDVNKKTNRYKYLTGIFVYLPHCSFWRVVHYEPAKPQPNTGSGIFDHEVITWGLVTLLFAKNGMNCALKPNVFKTQLLDTSNQLLQAIKLERLKFAERVARVRQSERAAASHPSHSTTPNPPARRQSEKVAASRRKATPNPPARVHGVRHSERLAAPRAPATPNSPATSRSGAQVPPDTSRAGAAESRGLDSLAVAAAAYDKGGTSGRKACADQGVGRGQTIVPVGSGTGTLDQSRPDSCNGSRKRKGKGRATAKSMIQRVLHSVKTGKSKLETKLNKSFLEFCEQNNITEGNSAKRARTQSATVGPASRVTSQATLAHSIETHRVISRGTVEFQTWWLEDGKKSEEATWAPIKTFIDYHGGAISRVTKCFCDYVEAHRGDLEKTIQKFYVDYDNYCSQATESESDG